MRLSRKDGERTPTGSIEHIKIPAHNFFVREIGWRVRSDRIRVYNEGLSTGVEIILEYTHIPL